MVYTSYKGRKVDPKLPVRVYRNLNKPKVTYSIVQKGHVVGHATHICLRDVTCHVNERGRQKVVATKRKHVHAWLSGYVVAHGPTNGYVLAFYDPYHSPTFCYRLSSTTVPFWRASYARLGPNGLMVVKPTI